MKLTWLCRAPDFKGSQTSVTSGFEILTFVYVKAATLNYCVISKFLAVIIR